MSSINNSQSRATIQLTNFFIIIQLNWTCSSPTITLVFSLFIFQKLSFPPEDQSVDKSYSSSHYETYPRFSETNSTEWSFFGRLLIASSEIQNKLTYDWVCIKISKNSNVGLNRTYDWRGTRKCWRNFPTEILFSANDLASSNSHSPVSLSIEYVIWFRFHCWCCFTI